MISVSKVRLGKSLRNPPPWLALNPDFIELINCVNNPQANLDYIKKLIAKVNESLKYNGLNIKLRKAPPWSNYDYILILAKSGK